MKWVRNMNLESSRQAKITPKRSFSRPHIPIKNDEEKQNKLYNQYEG